MIALKLDEVLHRLRNELSKVPGAKLIMVFGSVARGDYRPDSDVDVMLVADDVGKARRAAREVSSTIFADTGVPVTVIVVSPEEYLGESISLIRRAKREGFLLWKAEGSPLH